MDNENQNTQSGLGQTLVTPADQFASNPQPIGQAPAPAVERRARSSKQPRTVAIITTVFFLIFALVAIIISLIGPDEQDGNLATYSDPIDIPLDDLITHDDLILLGTRNLTVNGRLQAKDAFIISPSVQPTNATAGQIYYDTSNNKLAYYNGDEFIFLPAEGEGEVDTTTSAVLSVQGQTGNVSLTSGGGIAIDGTTLTNTGVLSIGGVTGNIALGPNLSIVENELRFSGVHSLEAGTSNLLIDNDGQGNLTISDLGGGGSGSVTSSGGTAGRIAKFTGVQNIEDSLLSESGDTITVNGDLSVTGTVALANPLAVGNGGTGATSLANNGVVISHGSGALTSVAAGGVGECLVSTAGAPIWASCPGVGGGVTSLDGLTGALILANSSGSGSTITIDDASTTQKGIAQFNATNFSSVAGVINTIQNINPAASPTFTNLTLSGDLAANGGDITSTGALNITPGGTLVVGATSQTLTLQGGAATTFSATSGANSTTLSFQAPAATVTYRLPTAAAGTYDVCSTAGNCTGVGGGVTTAGGTINRLAKFTAAQGIGDSTISDDGSSVSTTVDLIVQGGDVNVGVASTQTGTINFAHNASGFLGSITQGALGDNRTYTLPDSSGEFCLTSGNCSGPGSTNTLQAAYDAGNTLTTTTGRDLEFTLADTTVDANFDIVVADGSTSFVSFARANGGGTVDPAQMVLIENQDLDRALPVGVRIQSAAGGMTTGIDASDAEIVDALNIGANNIVGTTGNIDLANFDVVGSTGNITTAGDLAVNGGDITSTGTLIITPAGSLIMGSTTQTATLQGSAVTLTSSAGNDIILNSGDTIELQDATNVTGGLSATGTFTLGTLGATDTPTYLCRNASNQLAGCSTTGTGSAFVQGGNSFGTTAVLGTNDANGLNLEVNNVAVATFASNGAVLFKNQADSTTAFRVQNAANLDFIALNTSTSALTLGNGTGSTSVSVQCGTGTCGFGNNATDHSTSIGSATGTSITSIRGGTGGVSITSGALIALGVSDTTGTLLVLDTKTNSGDPTGVNGGMYYNANLGKFRCFQNSLWVDCVGATAAEFLRAENRTNQTTNVSLNDHVKFANVQGSSGSSITLDTTSGYSAGVGTASVGRFTLKGGKTYKMRATIPNTQFSASAAYLSYAWYDATNSVILGGGGCVLPVTYGATNDGCAPYAEAIFSPVADTLVEVRFTDLASFSGIGDSGATRKWFPSAYIELVSDGTSIAQFQGATAGTAGQAGFVPAPAAGQQGAVLLGNGTWSAGVSFISGAATFQNVTNSTTAFRILTDTGSSSLPLFTVDTSGSRVNIGNVVTDTTAVRLVLDSASGSDPTGVNGAMYYNTTNQKFRCFEDGRWINCTSAANEFDMFDQTDEFMTGGVTSGTAGSMGWSIYNSSGGATLLPVTGAQNHPGITRIGSGTTINNVTAMVMDGTNGVSSLATGDVNYFGAIVRPDSGSTTMSTRVGILVSSLAGGEASQGIYFSFVSGSNWRTVTRDATNITVNTTSVTYTPGTWYRLEMKKVSGNWEFYINGVLQFTHSTFIPPTTTLAVPAFSIETNEAVAKTLDVDWARLRTSVLVR